jgi:hypothetical protein
MVNIYYDHSLTGYDWLNAPSELLGGGPDWEEERQRRHEEARQWFINHLTIWNRATADVPGLLVPSLFDSEPVRSAAGIPFPGQIQPPDMAFPLESFRHVQFNRRNPGWMEGEGAEAQQVWNPEASAYTHHKALWQAAIGRFAEAPTQIWVHICNGLYPSGQITNYTYMEQRASIFEPGLRWPDNQGRSLFQDIADEFPAVPVYAWTTTGTMVQFGPLLGGTRRYRSHAPYWLWHVLTTLHWRYLAEHGLRIDSEP